METGLGPLPWICLPIRRVLVTLRKGADPPSKGSLAPECPKDSALEEDPEYHTGPRLQALNSPAFFFFSFSVSLLLPLVTLITWVNCAFHNSLTKRNCCSFLKQRGIQDPSLYKFRLVPLGTNPGRYNIWGLWTCRKSSLEMEIAPENRNLKRKDNKNMALGHLERRDKCNVLVFLPAALIKYQ